MRVLSKWVAGVAIACAATMASALTVQGITWNPDSTTPPDFQANGAPTYQWFQPGAMFNPGTALTFNAANIGALQGAFVTGAANISQINGVTNAAIFAPGRELTLVFGGVQITSINAIPIPGGGGAQFLSFGFDVSQSYFRVYSDNSLDYTTPTVTGLLADQVNAANTDFAVEFLSGRFDTFAVQSALLTAGGLFSGSAEGLISVLAGAAFDNFNTNSASLPAFPNQFADLSFTGSQQFSDGGRISQIGSTDLRGQTVPEPGTLALVGLSLLAAGFARRKTVA